MANESTLSAPMQAVRRLAGRRASAGRRPPSRFRSSSGRTSFVSGRSTRTGNLNGEADDGVPPPAGGLRGLEGRLVNAYWCVCEASAVALTAKPRNTGFARVFRQPPEIRFHSATDWVTRDSPEIANILHTCETLAVRASEILRGPTERIAMQWILATAGHMLGFVDASEGKRTRSETSASREEKAQRAREDRGLLPPRRREGRPARRTSPECCSASLWWQPRLVGARRGSSVVEGSTSWNETTTQNLMVSYSMGAVGALMSVMTRMSSSKVGVFTVDFEVGRGPLRSLGALPSVHRSDLRSRHLLRDEGRALPDPARRQQESIYLFAVVAFIAGFSERWVNVIFGRAQRSARHGRRAGRRRRSRQPRKGARVCRSCSIYCIVPPVVFEQIAKNGSKEQREWAIETVSRDNSLRVARIQNSLARGGGPIRADALAGSEPGQPKRTVYDAKNQEQVTGEVVRAEDGPAVRRRSRGRGFRRSRCDLQVLVRPLSARLDRRRRPPARRDRSLRRQVRQRLLGRSAHGLRRRRRGDVQPVHDRARHHRARAWRTESSRRRRTSITGSSRARSTSTWPTSSARSSSSSRTARAQSRRTG